VATPNAAEATPAFNSNLAQELDPCSPVASQAPGVAHTAQGCVSSAESGCVDESHVEGCVLCRVANCMHTLQRERVCARESARERESVCGVCGVCVLPAHTDARGALACAPHGARRGAGRLYGSGFRLWELGLKGGGGGAGIRLWGLGFGV